MVGDVGLFLGSCVHETDFLYRKVRGMDTAETCAYPQDFWRFYGFLWSHSAYKSRSWRVSAYEGVPIYFVDYQIDQNGSFMGSVENCILTLVISSQKKKKEQIL